MSSFIICLRKILVSVECAQIQYLLRLLLALRGITCIPWGFWSCLLLFMKVVSKPKEIFLHFFPVCLKSLTRSHIPIQGLLWCFYQYRCSLLLSHLANPCQSLGQNHGYHVWGDDGPLLPGFCWDAFSATCAGIVLSFSSVSVQETHDISVPGGIWGHTAQYATSHTLPPYLHAKPKLHNYV